MINIGDCNAVYLLVLTAITLTCDRCTMKKISITGPVGMAWDTSLGNPRLDKLILCIFKAHNEVWLYLTT